ncbi:DEAD/DEAH box helicase [Hoylesella oralis ATCC 33269]|uniref:DEAD/DEAH box helicase n=1 Tax=Hoylesella oralis ATCC 33269 TaxID=873533 RepID=E7RSW5_9BACT|nr:DEAD/DEAH box helicase [Hoylesella oralis]EFZ36316.1 DEAD/DEAH box helicase [Hoylesella oralis ATCC 33269]EPH19903.1 hypothetical protein HMPREF1475_00105 [Hoylesella oralis HGA0225]SHF58009.1 Superfamily II DNA and RNA helicase [Hoylesella oralis]
MYFDELNLNNNVLDALYDMHFDTCTPVQERCIPEILNKRDVLGVAQTGTGKTAAYLLPILSMLDDGGYPKDAINCIIMSPTRELAQQIDQAMQGFGYYLSGVSSVAVYGGNDGNRYDQELKSLRLGADVVIATPGRFISHISLGNVDLSKVSFFILDEADRMLDMGFSEDIMTIAKQLPPTCQTIMFSATMPDKIEELANTLLKNPVTIKLAVSKPAEKIRQSAYVCYETQKMDIIKNIFNAGDLKRVIIFSGSKQKVKQITKALQQKNVNCGEMHSDLEQAQRDDMMFKFKSGQLDVIVATDIISRGIDIDDIAMVINYDVPHDAEDYVHRIGRTARADRDGVAITLINEDDIYYFQQIEKFLGKPVEKTALPEGLGKGPEYKSHGKPQRGGRSAKAIRRKSRDTNAHRHKPKVNGDDRQQHKSDNSNGTKAERSRQTGDKERNNRNKNRQQQSNKPRHDRQQQSDGPQQQQADRRQQRNGKQGRQQDNRQQQHGNQQHKPNSNKNRNYRQNRNKSATQPAKTAPKQESRIKQLIKKPLKWLKSFGR